MSEQLTLFAEDTLASHLAQPGNDLARKMTATSGRNLVGSWLNSGPLGSLERTLLVTSAWASTMCFLTWKAKVTPAGRLLFQLAPSVPTTGAIDAGLLGTPRLWSTPQAQGRGGRQTPGSHLSLNKQVQGWRKDGTRMWPTPNANDNRDRGSAASASVEKRKAKGKQIMLSQSVSSESGALNPTWVEWLMGFPLGWPD